MFYNIYRIDNFYDTLRKSKVEQLLFDDLMFEKILNKWHVIITVIDNYVIRTCKH